MPQDINAAWVGCGNNFLIGHTLSFPKVGIVLEWHDDAAKEWGTLVAWVLTPSATSYEP